MGSSRNLRAAVGRALAASWPILVVHAALLGLYDPERWIGWVVIALLAAPLALIHGRRSVGKSSVGVLPVLLGVAALLRLLMVPLSPSLSEDVHRYVWDGKVAAAGANPYLLPPQAEELASLRDDGWAILPHRDVETVYPPLAVAAFSAVARTPRPVLAWKLLLVAADLLACLWLARLARETGRSEAVCVWYAWNPLATLEIAGMGHLEGLGVLAAVAAVRAVVRRRPMTGGVWAAAAVLTKLVPAAVVPVWAAASKRPWRFAVVAAALSLTALAPVLLSTGGVPPGWQRFGISWEFNGPIYEPLWRTIDATDAVASVKGWLDGRKQATGDHEGWNRWYPWVYPQLMAKLLLAAALAVAWLVSLRERDPVSATGRVFGWVVLFSATVYPWYLLWILPWAALRSHRAWLLLCATISLSYLPQVTRLPLMPWIFSAIWLPFAALLLFDRRSSRWSTA